MLKMAWQQWMLPSWLTSALPLVAAIHGMMCCWTGWLCTSRCWRGCCWTDCLWSWCDFSWQRRRPSHHLHCRGKHMISFVDLNSIANLTVLVKADFIQFICTQNFQISVSFSNAGSSSWESVLQARNSCSSCVQFPHQRSILETSQPRSASSQALQWSFCMGPGWQHGSSRHHPGASSSRCRWHMWCRAAGRRGRSTRLLLAEDHPVACAVPT